MNANTNLQAGGSAPDTDKLQSVIRSERFQADVAAQLTGSDVEIDKFTATVLAAIRHNPKILEAERNSVYNAILEAAADGLMPDGDDGVINIYNTRVSRNPDRWESRAQWQRMVGGIIKLCAKANVNIYAVSIYSNEVEKGNLKVWNDTEGQHVVHEPILFGDRGERVGALAVARLADGQCRFEAMNVDDLKKARAASKSPESGPWKEWPERMEQKSAMHRLVKRIAFIDPNIAARLRKLNEEFAEDPLPPETSTINVATKRPTALQKALDAPPVVGTELPGQRAPKREQEPEFIPAGTTVDSDGNDQREEGGEPGGII